MPQTLARLHADHRNYARMLSLLKSDIDKLSNSTDPDFIRLYDIMNYMTNYPDISHHPAEEIIFERLRALSPETSPVIETLVREHAELATRGKAFKEKLSHVTSGAIISRPAIIEAGNNYHELLNSHMNTEEAQLFPVIEKLFSDEDWRTVDARIDEVEDPLFGNAVQEQFADLYRRITLSEKQTV